MDSARRRGCAVVIKRGVDLGAAYIRRRCGIVYTMYVSASLLLTRGRGKLYVSPGMFSRGLFREHVCGYVFQELIHIRHPITAIDKS